MSLLDKVILKTASGLGTRTCFILFIVIALLPLFLGGLPSTILAWQTFVSQTFIQLLALSVLAYCGKIEGNQTRELLQAEIQELKAIMDSEHQQNLKIEHMIRVLELYQPNEFK